MNQKHLLFNFRFWPSFWTQFFGAFNDNVYKNALVMLITYKSYSLAGLSPESMVALCGGIFILPFFLFSAVAGQICDKYSKSRLMYLIKLWEIIVMLIGAYGFISENLVILLITLFLMGLQSSFFGPVKYSILPDLVDEVHLVEGNALVEMGTFVAILLGTIVGGALMAIEQSGKIYVAISVIVFAMIGTLFSKKVVTLAPGDSQLTINYGIIKPTWNILKIVKNKQSVFLAVLGISWFWFLGAALLSMFPGYVKNYLNGNQHVVIFFLALFSIGVAVGSILCEKMSRERLELGLVPFGTIGMTLFIFDIFLIGEPISNPDQFLTLKGFITDSQYFRLIFDLFGLSVFSGFFTVPLYTFIQAEAKEEQRSRVIAGLNIINALFMVCSAIFLTAFYSLNFSMPAIFGILAICNLIVSIYIYSVIPEFMLRFWAMIISRIMYRVKVHGHEFIPKSGGCILTCNHVSFVDWLILAAAVKRPVRFIMYYKFMEIPVIKYLFQNGKVIPIARKSEDEKILIKAMDEIAKALENGDIICIFPEGEITKDGSVGLFKRGIDSILKRTPVPVIPICINGLWGSFFSRKYNGKALSKPSVLFRTWLRRVDLLISPPLDEGEISAQVLEDLTKKHLTHFSSK